MSENRPETQRASSSVASADVSGVFERVAIQNRGRRRRASSVFTPARKPRTTVGAKYAAVLAFALLATPGAVLLASVHVALAVGVAVLALVPAVVVTAAMTRRLRRLRQGVERIVAADLDHRIELSGSDELRQAADVINLLAGSLAEDISQRQQSERSLFATEAQYRTLFENSHDAILMILPSGQIVEANDATLDLLRYTREQLSGLHARKMYKNPTDWNRFRDEMAKRDSLHDFEAQFRTKDGAIIDCLFTATAQRDDRGRVASYQSIIRDITKQKVSEKLLAEYSQNLERRVAERTQELSRTLDNLKTTQNQLVEAEKMAALGALVAGVAHEINTPVGIGVTAASTLEKKTKDIRTRYEGGQLKRSDFAKYIDAASTSSKILLTNLDRAASLIRSFKQVAVDQSSEQRRPFAIQGYLHEVLLSLHPKLKRTRHSIEIDCDDSLMITSYPGAFSQIITNLVMNSLIHAYGPDDAGQIRFDIHRVGDDRITIEYADDGCGVPEEHRVHIFEPFFSTKRGQGGSGLGLHVVYNLVTQRLKGTIRCDSEVGKGTRFTIEMPITE